MDSMRNYQFEDERDVSAVERSAEVADFLGAEVARIDSGDERRADWLQPSLPMRRDGAFATGSIVNQVDDAPRPRDPLEAYFRTLDNTQLLSRDEELALASSERQNTIAAAVHAAMVRFCERRSSMQAP